MMEAVTTVEGYRQGPQYDGECSSILIVNFSVQLQQTKTSDRKLSIFQSGLHI